MGNPHCDGVFVCSLIFLGHHLSSLSCSFILPTLNSILFKKSDLLNIGFHVHTLSNGL